MQKVKANKGVFYILIRDIDIFYKSNRLIPAKLDSVLGKIKDKNQGEFHELSKLILDLNDRHCRKNEDGTLMMIEVKNGDTTQQQYDVIDKEAHRKEMDEIMAQEVSFWVDTVNPSDLGQTLFDKGKSTFEAFKKYIVRDGVFKMG